MLSRRKRLPSVYNVHIPLQTAQHSIGAQHLLAAFIKHLVFSREQCHAPFSELQKHTQACRQLQQQQPPGRHVRLKIASRKAIKYHDKLCSLIQLVGHVPFSTLAGQPVTIILGSSVMRPREVYSFTFSDKMDQLGTCPPDDDQLGEASRRMLRMLIMQHSSVTEWDQAPGPTKMFLLFQSPEGSLPAAPEGFLTKRAFSINLKKAFQVNINLGPSRLVQPDADRMQCDGGKDEELQRLSQQLSTHMQITDTAAGELQTAAVPPANVWYQCVVHVKGLKPPALG